MKPATGALLLVVGIFGIFPRTRVSCFPSSGTSGSTIQLGLSRSSKTNGNEYATHRPYKADFDLLRVSERSQELAMPLIFSNDLDGDKDAAIRILTSDPTLRSRRKRQIPISHQIFFGLNPTFGNNAAASPPPNNVVGQQQQRHSALAVPASSPAFFIPSSSLSHPAALSITPAGAATVNRNELSILANYYQPQELPPQSPPLQVGIFQGPLPVQRQRPQLDGIHTNYPYPYPPTLDVSPQSPVVPESVATGDNNINGVTTDYPMEGSTDSTHVVSEQQQGGQQQGDPASGSFPDSPAHLQEGQSGSTQTTEASSTAPPAAVSLPAAVGGPLNDPGFTQQLQLQELAMQKRLREKEEEIHRLRSQLEQANLQVVSYEQENSMIKDQFQRSEEANLKLRDRVLQLENTNQHLQDQNGQLQQANTEHRQEANALKVALKEAKEQLSNMQQQKPASEEALQHRKEIEGFLIRIRKLGEESETCKQQVKLYQLKINYIQNQQRGKDKEQKEQKEQKEGEQKHVEFQDDELDPELSRMDAEIAALQKNAEEVAAQIQDLQPPLSSAIPESAVPVQVAEQKVVPPQTVEVKNESEFPGEAVQVPQRPQQPESPPQKTVATAEEIGRGSTWEKPEGF